MAEKTEIQYCDSTLNLQMGCDGCELWEPKGVQTCYAGRIIEEYAGHPGFPASFSQPKIFPDRMATALKWRDLTFTDRPTIGMF